MPKNGFRQQAQQPAAAAFQARFNQALALHQQGKLAEAELIYEEILQRAPNHFDALHMLGVLAVQTRRPERGVELIGKAIKLNAMNAAAHSNLGNALLDLKRFKDALASYDKAIELKPDYAEAYNNRGNALKDLKRPEDALGSYGKAITLKPDYAEAYNNRGNTLLELKRLEEALVSYGKAIALKPDYAKAHNSRGFLLLQLNRPGEALASCDKAIALKSDNAETHFNRGAALKALKQLDAAIASYDKAIAVKPDYAEAYNNRGNALRDLNRHAEALTNYDKAIALKPNYAEAYYNYGNLFLDLKRFEDALANYDKAIALKPDYAGAYNNRGSLLMDMRRPESALASFDKAILLTPNYAEAYNNRGAALLDLKRSEDALASYGKAIALKPEYAEAHRNRGLSLSDLKRFDEAFSAFDKAYALKPELTGIEGDRLYSKMRFCEWSHFDAECAHLISSVRNGKANTSPFEFLAIPSSSADQLQCARSWIETKHPRVEKSIWQGERYDHDRIRVAYLSADFHDHPMAHLMAGLFESHDRKRFETFAFSFGPDVKSDVRSRLKAAFDRFIDVSDMSDRDVAMLMRELEIDIAVDRKGFTKNSRTGIFAFRAAPIQINYLAYPGTMGAEYIDYILADRIVIPEEHRRYYAEKVVYFPHSYQANDSKRRIAEHTPTRTELGLPEQGFVFCCFNNIYKITPRSFDSWMRILGQVEGSVLWLMDDNANATGNLRKEAAARGVNPERLMFAKRQPLAEHLARHRVADLFVDTLPYNAHTTASDALWAGLPLLTCRGETFAGRVAASLLTAIGLPDLITTSLEAYERMAIDLATHPEQLTAIKRKLAENRLTTPLFDTKSITQHIEAAYNAMHERHQAGLPPEHIVISN